MSTSVEKLVNILLISFFLVIPFGVSLEIKTNITPSQSLKEGDVLVSTQKKFALGFFSPRNSRYRYVGIWYNKVPQQTVVWVANRENPINDSSGVLSINGQGTLVIYSYNNTDTPLCNPYNLDTFSCMCLLGFKPKSPRDWYLRDGSAGCVRKQGVTTCQNGEGFAPVLRVKAPDTSIARLSKGLNLKECENLCLINCSSMAYGNANEIGNEFMCLMWHGDLVDTRIYTNVGKDLYIRVDAATLGLEVQSTTRKKWVYL